VTEAWVPAFAGTTKGRVSKSPPDQELGNLDDNLSRDDPLIRCLCCREMDPGFSPGKRSILSTVTNIRVSFSPSGLDRSLNSEPAEGRCTPRRESVMQLARNVPYSARRRSKTDLRTGRAAR
jgi:hypothetical protein